MATRRAINHSKAFWELKAEQVMDRVFRNAAQAYPHPPELPSASEAAASAISRRSLKCTESSKLCLVFSQSDTLI